MGAPAPAAVRAVALHQVLARARFNPRQVPPGRVLVIPARSSGQTISVPAARMVHAPVPACLPPPIGRPGAFPGACCPPPERQVLAGRPKQVLAEACPKMRGQRPARRRQIHIAVHPVASSRGGVPNRVIIACPAPVQVQGRPGHRRH
jgi:hypothetical protein